MSGKGYQEVDTRARLVVVGVLIVALFAGLLTRLWFLQVTGGEKLAVAAQQQRDRTVDVPALRGAVLDAKGRVLAETVLVTSLTVDRQQLTTTQREKLVGALSFFLELPPDESRSGSTTCNTTRSSRCRWPISSPRSSSCSSTSTPTPFRTRRSRPHRCAGTRTARSLRTCSGTPARSVPRS